MIPRIYKLGGVVTPMKEAAPDWIKTWRDDEGPARPALLLRLRLRIGPERALLAAATRARGRTRCEYPFKSFDGSVTFQRQRSGSARVRLHEGRRGPLRALPGLVGGHPARGRCRRCQGHGARSRGLPPGLGARQRDPLRLQVARASASPAEACGRIRLWQHLCAAAATRWSAQGSRQPGVDLVRPRQEGPRQEDRGGPYAGRQGGARGQQHQGQRPPEGPRGRSREPAARTDPTNGQWSARGPRWSTVALRLRGPGWQHQVRGGGNAGGVEEPHGAAALPGARQTRLTGNADLRL